VFNFQIYLTMKISFSLGYPAAGSLENLELDIPVNPAEQLLAIEISNSLLSDSKIDFYFTKPSLFPENPTWHHRKAVRSIYVKETKRSRMSRSTIKTKLDQQVAEIGLTRVSLGIATSGFWKIKKWNWIYLHWKNFQYSISRFLYSKCQSSSRILILHLLHSPGRNG